MLAVFNKTDFSIDKLKKRGRKTFLILIYCYFSGALQKKGPSVETD